MRPNPELIVIGGSAGGFEVILQTLSVIDPGLSLPIVIVLHRKSNSDATLVNLLSSRSRLVVKEAEEKELIIAGKIYVAPADYHLLIEKDHTFSLDHSEKVNYSRPCIDLTFQTAAEAYGNTLACLLLSGANTDGVDGLRLVHEAGGITAVQNPETAAVSFMPQKALEKIKVDHILNSNEVSDFIHLLAYLKTKNLTDHLLQMNTHKRVFIFDDDPDILELCAIILQSKGYEVCTSESSSNIIEKVSLYKPDIIFMDNWIPDIGGAEATRLLKADEQLKHIPIIYFSANNDIHILAQKAGADDYLPKPFNISELENMVEKTLMV